MHTVNTVRDSAQLLDQLRGIMSGNLSDDQKKEKVRAIGKKIFETLRTISLNDGDLFRQADALKQATDRAEETNLVLVSEITDIMQGILQGIDLTRPSLKKESLHEMSIVPTTTISQTAETFFTNPEHDDIVARILSLAEVADLCRLAKVCRALHTAVTTPKHVQAFLSNVVATSTYLHEGIFSCYQERLRLTGTKLAPAQATQACLRAWQSLQKAANEAPLHVKFQRRLLTPQLLDLLGKIGVGALTLDGVSLPGELSKTLSKLPSLNFLKIARSTIDATLDLAELPNVSKLIVQNCPNLQVDLSEGNALEELHIVESEVPNLDNARNLRVLRLHYCYGTAISLVLPEGSALESLEVNVYSIPQINLSRARNLKVLQGGFHRVESIVLPAGIVTENLLSAGCTLQEVDANGKSAFLLDLTQSQNSNNLRQIPAKRNR